MRDFVYARPVTESDASLGGAQPFELVLLDENIPVRPAYPFDALMVSRLDFEVRVTDLPEGSERDIRKALSYKIRSYDRGKPEQAVFDFELTDTANKNQAVVFLTEQNTLEAYRSLARDRSLFLPYGLVRPLLKHFAANDELVLFWNPAWVEIMLFWDGDLVSSSVVEREEQDPEFLQGLRRLVPEVLSNCRCLVLYGSFEKELVHEHVEELDLPNATIEYLTFNQAVDLLTDKPALIFEKRKRLRSALARSRLPLEIAVVLLLAVLNLNSFVSGQDTYLARLNDALERTVAPGGELESLAAENEALIQRVAELQRRRPLDVYALLAELDRVASGRASVSKLVLNDGFLQLEGETADPVRFADLLTTKPLFRDTRLTDTSRTQDATIRSFRIVGTIDED